MQNLGAEYNWTPSHPFRPQHCRGLMSITKTDCPICGFELKKKDLPDHIEDDLTEANDMIDLGYEMVEKIYKYLSTPPKS